LIRSGISLTIAAFLFGLAAFVYPEVPLWVTVAITLFGLLFCFITWGSVRHHRALLAARTTTPVSANIHIRATPQRRGPDRLVAEITLDDQIWRGSLTGWKHERQYADTTVPGWVWLNPKTGAPLELKINADIITPIPIVVKVNKDSFVEKLIRKFVIDPLQK